ncbi:MAG: UvrD-helicase domain-containing protein [Blautia sp.]|nr:UvrD-helicase domain-containing protein [Blautia sp.]
METLLGTLNPAQLEAVTATEGYIRVIAGAGSGKTRALSHRFAYLVNEVGILPGNILCVTFTNKASQEMRQRIHALTGDNDTGYINTFHGFCVSILQEDSYAVEYPKSFLVLDNADIDTMLKVIYEERGLGLRDMTFAKARDMIEIQKLFKKPEYYLDMLTLPLEELKQKYQKAETLEDIIFYGYLYQERKCFGLDYNDLIKVTLFIFSRSEEIRLKWQKRLEYIMIDEFQDIDGLQYELMCVLSAYHKNLFVVGDPDQTIYTWRGANIRYLLDFGENFPGCRTIMMMLNYRSTATILRAVNSLIDKNQERIRKSLIPAREEGEKPVCHFASNAEKEAAWIAQEVMRLKEKEGIPLKSITILYRAHYVTRSLEEAFIKEKIPYAIYSGTPFFGRKEIKDALAYLRMIVYRDDLSFLRIANEPKRNLGEQRIRYLQEYAATKGCSLFEALKENQKEELFARTKAVEFISLIEGYAEKYETVPVSDLIGEILSVSGYENDLRIQGSQERLDNLAELKQSIRDYELSCGEEGTLEQYVRHIALFTNMDTPEKEDRLKLMTVHSAKGLEFPVVFLCGMNEGIFPSRKIRSIQAMEEERRLAFVAMTRARDHLYMTEADGRNFDGSDRYPSRFILDAGEENLSFPLPPREGLIQKTKEYVDSMNRHILKDENRILLPEGQRIRHKIFGEGTITGIDQEREAYRIHFDRLDSERNIAFRIALEVL